MEEYNRREYQHFNSRPHGGRRRTSPEFRRPENFNSRPHGGRRTPRPRRVKATMNFNSRPHGGRHGTVVPSTG